MIAAQEYIKLRTFETKGGCWIWDLSLNDAGYGKATYNYKDYKAHRLSYMAFKGTIPDGLVVCHTCDIRQCVNPAHLFLGTQQDNVCDMVKKGRAATGNWFGIGNTNKSKPVKIENNIFESCKIASSQLNINYRTLLYRVNNENCPNYCYI